MAEQRVGIISECICDMPKSYLKEHNVGVVYFNVKTESGVFTDTDEITAENILSYMRDSGRLPLTSPPPPETYAAVFREGLQKYGDVIFVSTGSGASLSNSAAQQAAELMGAEGKRVHIFDSDHLSTGLGHVIIKAVEMAESGAGAEEILSALRDFRGRVSTSFIAVNADYLYRNGRVPGIVKSICDIFGIHPVLMMKNGALTLSSVKIGNYDKACLRYIRGELKHRENIDRSRIFITHVGCSLKKLEKIKAEVSRICPVDELTVTKASATISCNCGPNTFGVFFVSK